MKAQTLITFLLVSIIGLASHAQVGENISDDPKDIASLTAKIKAHDKTYLYGIRTFGVVKGYLDSDDLTSPRLWITSNSHITLCEGQSDPAICVHRSSDQKPGYSYVKAEYLAQRNSKDGGGSLYVLKYGWVANDDPAFTRHLIKPQPCCNVQRTEPLNEKAHQTIRDGHEIAKQAAVVVKGPIKTTHCGALAKKPAISKLGKIIADKNGFTLERDGVFLRFTDLAGRCDAEVPTQTCAKSIIPAGLKLYGLVEMMRVVDRANPAAPQCRDVQNQFEESCGAWPNTSREERAKKVIGEIRRVVTPDWKEKMGVDPLISPELIMCLMRKESPTFNPVKLSDRACSGSKMATDFGLGQFIASSVPSIWADSHRDTSQGQISHAVESFSDPNINKSESMARARSVHFKMGEDPALAIRMMVFLMHQKINQARHRGNLSGAALLNDAIYGYHGNWKDGYLKEVSLCLSRIHGADPLGFMLSGEGKSGYKRRPSK